jgi:hypothetical protein
MEQEVWVQPRCFGPSRNTSLQDLSITNGLRTVQNQEVLVVNHDRVFEAYVQHVHCTGTSRCQTRYLVCFPMSAEQESGRSQDFCCGQTQNAMTEHGVGIQTLAQKSPVTPTRIKLLHFCQAHWSRDTGAYVTRDCAFLSCG